MGRAGWFGLAVALVAAVVGFGIYSTTIAVNMCVASARTAVDRADPFDRNPPPTVAAVVAREVGLSRLSDELSSVLLDRLSCTQGDWLVVRPALAWRIQRSFSDSQRVAMFASTVDTGAGTLGLAAGARQFYRRSVAELGETSVACLVRKARGMPRERWSACGTEGLPPDLIAPPT
jgi:hypothetical protein